MAPARGFSLIEILIALSVLAILSMLAFSTFTRFASKQALSASVNEVLSALTDARARTLASKEDSAYGVHFAASTVTLFSGDVFDPDSEENVVRTLNRRVQISDITLAGGADIVLFERLSGETQNAGTIELELLGTESMQSITIEATGLAHITQ